MADLTPDAAAGLVVAAHGRHAWVEDGAGRLWQCVPRGKKSDFVVGDRVHWQPSGDGGVIEAITPRRNLLFRQDEWRSKSFAANIDQLLVLVAVQPPFGDDAINRALVAAAAANIPAAIGLNKTDLPGADALRERLAPYRAMGSEVIELALKADADGARRVLGPWLAGKATLVLGPSGMGKSTLINRLVLKAAAAVGDISSALNTGRHTTTHTRWYWLDETRQAALIDSPGFQAFGLRQVGASELASLMPDLAAHLGDCRFANCSHRHEPGCGVRAALARGDISTSRMRFYETLHAELSEAPKW